MSDLIEKIAEAMRTEFRELYGKEWSGPHNPPSFTTSDLVLAHAALSAIKENAGVLVRPLVWEDYAEDEYFTECSSYTTYKTEENKWALRSGEVKIDDFYSLPIAKAAAQAHHTASVLSHLNLEVE